MRSYLTWADPLGLERALIASIPRAITSRITADGQILPAKEETKEELFYAPKRSRKYFPTLKFQRENSQLNSG